MSDDNELDNAKNILIDGIGALLGDLFSLFREVVGDVVDNKEDESDER